MKPKKILIILLLTILSFMGYGYYFLVYRYLPYSPIRPHRITENEITQTFGRRVNPSDLGMKFQEHEIVIEDSIILRGWFIFSKLNTNKGTMILLHGSANCKESLLGLADTFSTIGFNIILFDSRAHGQSGGMNCTFGYYEKKDVSKIIDAMLNVHRDIEPIGIYGNSLGAAIALQTMAIDKRIKCGIIESPFATLREVVYDYWKRMSGLPIHFIPDNALKVSEQIAKFSVDSVKPEVAAYHINSSVLIIHGDADEHISFEYGKRVFANLPSKQKELYLINGAGHYNLSSVGGKIYFIRVTNFLQANLK